MKITLLMLLALIVVASIRHNAAAKREENSKAASPLVVFTGDNSHVKKPSALRVTSEAAWKRVWLEHLGLEQDTIYRPAMEIDFAACEVVVVFRGSDVNSCGLTIESMTNSADATIVRFDDISFQSDGGFVNVTPYAFIVLPKTRNTIVLEENVQEFIGKPAVWKELTRLPSGS